CLFVRIEVIQNMKQRSTILVLWKIEQAAMGSFHFPDPGVGPGRWCRWSRGGLFLGLGLSRAYTYKARGGRRPGPPPKTSAIGQVRCLHACLLRRTIHDGRYLKNPGLHF